MTEDCRPRLLLVDDEPANLQILRHILQEDYRLLFARNGEKALQLAADESPNLILLDVMMPDIDGFEVCRRLKSSESTRMIPVMFLTSLDRPEDEELGFALGAEDFIHKPVSPPVVLARVRTQLELKAARDRLAGQNQWLEHELARRLHESELAQDLALCALAELAETRDNETGNHIRRTQLYLRTLARHLQGKKKPQAVRLGAESIL